MHRAAGCTGWRVGVIADLLGSSDFFILAIGATLITVFVNPIVSLLVLQWFRRVLRRSMLASAHPVPNGPVNDAPQREGESEESALRQGE
jgi:hypothetical protein